MSRGPVVLGPLSRGVAIEYLLEDPEAGRDAGSLEAAALGRLC